MTVCDSARESNTEAGVYHLRGARQRVVPQGFPFVASRLWLFLVLQDRQSHFLRAPGAPSPLRGQRSNPGGRRPLEVFDTRSRSGFIKRREVMSSKAKCRSQWQRKVT